MNKDEDNKDKSETEKGNSGFNKFIRYSSLAFEMGIIIAAGTYGGYWLDNHFSFEKPILTICLSLFAVLSSLFLVIRQLLNDNK
jgi:hypothetical protein